MARIPSSAARPRTPGWDRPYQRSINLSLLELRLVREFAEREGLSVGAAIRELAVSALLIEADARPDASEWNGVLAGARDQHLARGIDASRATSTS